MADKLFHLEIVTPGKVVFKGDVISFSAPGVVGGFQVLFNHAPMLAEIGTGELKIRGVDNSLSYFATSGGFVDVLNNNVTVIAETVEKSDEIDKNRATSARDRAKKELSEKSSDASTDEKKAAIDRALNRIRIAEKR